jgi:riboflavin synthase alpha subunit
MMTILKVLGAGVVALLFAASPQPQDVTFAQAMQQAAPAAPPVRVRGTIASIDGSTLTVKARDGAEMKVKLADNAPVNQIMKASLAEVKTGAYVAVTGMPQPDGSQKALAVYIFPEAQRGLAEGHRPWDFAPNSTMTNATVDTQAAGVDGQTLTVKYKDGQQKILVTPATEITIASKKSAADLKPGQKISVFAAKKLPDGTLEAPNISFGDYGVWR